jgi:hypothetical protein
MRSGDSEGDLGDGSFSHKVDETAEAVRFLRAPGGTAARWFEMTPSLYSSQRQHGQLGGQYVARPPLMS